MSGFLFNDIIFGPVKSRRFGTSLGINLMPDTMKYCSFDCIYCECGLTDKQQDKKARLYTSAEIISAMEQRFSELRQEGLKPDNITFAGNGEPTMHPDFEKIIDATIQNRDRVFPNAHVTVLSNATRLSNESVRRALLKVDNNVLKLDAGTEEMYMAINRPLSPVKLNDVVRGLQQFEGNVIIQTLFLRGVVDGKVIDNTTNHEVELWLQHVKSINPKLVMLYSLQRETPEQGLQNVGIGELQEIAARVIALGINAEVYG